MLVTLKWSVECISLASALQRQSIKIFRDTNRHSITRATIFCFPQIVHFENECLSRVTFESVLRDFAIA